MFILCTINPSNLPSIKFNFKFGIDKVVHFLLFGILALLILIPNYNNCTNGYLLKAFLISSAYGISIEIIQGLFFANRTFDYADMLANTFGALFFTLMFMLSFLAKKI